MFVPFPYSFRGDGTSRWFRYGSLSSLSENDPGDDAAKGSTLLSTANWNLTRAIWYEVSKKCGYKPEARSAPSDEMTQFRFNSLGG